MSTIVITGGCGFVGSNLAVALAADGHSVVCFDNLSRRGSELLLDRVRAHGCRFVHGDVRNPEDFAKLGERCDVLVECSAEPSVLAGSSGNEAAYMVNVNLVGAVNCFEFARRTGAAVLFFSTSRVYPYGRINALEFQELDTRFELSAPAGATGVSDAGIGVDFPLAGPRSLYGATKLAAELLLTEYSANFGVPSIINRCGVIAGPWQLGKVDQGVFTYWLAAHYFRRPLSYIGFGGNGRQVRDLLHINDLVELVRRQLAVIGECHADVYNAGGSRTANLSLAETTELCRTITGNTVPIAAELAQRHADVIWYLTDNRGIERFGWSPVHDARAVIADTYEWLREHEADFAKLLGA